MHSVGVGRNFHIFNYSANDIERQRGSDSKGLNVKEGLIE